jgi:hypothetical protein
MGQISERGQSSECPAAISRLIDMTGETRHFHSTPGARSSRKGYFLLPALQLILEFAHETRFINSYISDASISRNVPETAKHAGTFSRPQVYC